MSLNFPDMGGWFEDTGLQDATGLKNKVYKKLLFQVIVFSCNFFKPSILKYCIFYDIYRKIIAFLKSTFFS